MRSISLVIFLFSFLNSCSAQRNTVDKLYLYSYTNKPTVLDNSIQFEADSTLFISGGKGQYAYSTFPNYKVLNDSTYLIYYPNFKLRKPTKEELKDTLRTQIYMADVFNDTIYWKNDKEFIFRERLFKLYEYKGIPLEDQ
ncbi:hypothetical protein [uncultured Aquimarina sp.]|uniref:hypothetical protein n=1 Tax=uncultured Aquimarina sp. TaxID=575652 RepID=UPI002623E082|nr:hypothetical protein [uncultured Aquimarina sp.]